MVYAQGSYLEIVMLLRDFRPIVVHLLRDFPSFDNPRPEVIARPVLQVFLDPCQEAGAS